MGKQTKQGLWREAFNLSKQIIRGLLPNKWEIMRLAVAITFVALGSAIAVVFGFVQGWDVAGKIMLGVIGGEIALVLLFWFSTWFIAIIITPWSASKVAENKDKEIKEQKEIVEYLKSRDRKANGDLIELRETKGKTWAGIEIHNGEKGDPFSGNIQVLQVTGHSITNALELLNADTRSPGFTSPAEWFSTVKVLSWYNQPQSFPSIFANTSNRVVFNKTGDYFITTQMTGTFQSSFSTAVVIRATWQFSFNAESKGFVFKRLTHERVHKPAT